ncbi:CS1-pili formation C-terminal domain-containing protein [Vibrio sp. MA40-2]|uniref:CS1-pili formation C-terminal domain-containing protein n=1 Tax=Vibrio sp. MA40-2 TaxID=3391828 RepID=UPI0039A6889A
MTKYSVTYSFLFILILFSRLVYSSVPSEFMDLYDAAQRRVNVIDVQGRVHAVTLNVSYDTTTLTSLESERELTKILVSNSVSDALIDVFIADLKKGIKNDQLCANDPSKCREIPDVYSLYYDYYTNKLHFRVNPKYVELSYNNEELQYASAYNENNALINSVNIYATADKDYTNFSLYDKVIVGLPYGHISSEINYRSSESYLDIDEFLYNLEFDNYKLTTGYTNNRVSFNATDFLINDVKNGEWSLDFGTSKNLVLSGPASVQKIFYFSPSNGVLTIYRDDKIILQKNINQGQGFITNSDLPFGRYDIRMVIYSGTEIVKQEIRSIYNTHNDSLQVKGVDFRTTVGTYEDTNSDLLGSIDAEKFNEAEFDEVNAYVVGEPFVRGLLAYRPVDFITIGGGVSLSNVGNYVNFGSKIYLPYQSQATVSAYIYDDNSSQFEASLNFKNWTASVENFDVSGEDDLSLSQYMFNESDYLKYTLATNVSLGMSKFGYLSYNYIDQEGSGYFGGFKSTYLSGGVSFNTAGNSTIDINGSYDFSGEQRDDLSLSVVWSVPLSDSVTGRSTVRTTESGITQISAGLTTDDLVEDQDIYANAQVTQNYSSTHPNNYTSVSSNAQVTKEPFTAGAYAYMDTSGERSINVNLSSSQIITKNKNLYLTKDKAESYLAINTESNIRYDQESASRGLLVIDRNGNQQQKEILYADRSISALRSYSSYNSYYDAESVDLYNVGDRSAQAYSLPGTVLELEPSITKVVTFISGFRNIFNTPINDIECVGTGCVSMTELMDGIYKVSVREGQRFSLIGNEEICLIPSIDDADVYNFGDNYCIPDIELLAYNNLKVSSNQSQILFLGEYDNSFDQYISKADIDAISRENIQILEHPIGKRNFVYALISPSHSISEKVKNTFETMSRHAKTNKIIDAEYALSN